MRELRPPMRCMGGLLHINMFFQGTDLDELYEEGGKHDAIRGIHLFLEKLSS